MGVTRREAASTDAAAGRNRPKLDVLTILAKRAGLIGVTRQEVASTDAAGGPRCPALGAAALEAAHP